jgi:hypothetical protein
VLLLLICAAVPRAAAQAPANPLAPPPWAGTFSDGAVRLALGPAPGGFAGTVTVGGRDLAARGTIDGGQLRGEFELDGHRFSFTASLSPGDPSTLVLVSDGVTRRLSRTPVDAAPTPTARGADALAGADDRPGSAWRHPAGWVAFELAPGWAVQQVEEATVVVSPGAADAVVVVSGGPLEADDRERAPDDLMRESGPALLVELQVQAAGPPVDVGAIGVRGVPGHVLMWSGTRGGAPVKVWVAGLRAPSHYALVVALVEAPRLEAHLPGLRRLVATLTLTPPPDVPAVDLAGSRFRHVETFPGGSFYSSYTFAAGGRVQRSLSGAGGATEAWGAYAVDGEVVRLRFDDGEDSLELVRGQGGAIVALRRSDGREYRATSR